MKELHGHWLLGAEGGMKQSPAGVGSLLLGLVTLLTIVVGVFLALSPGHQVTGALTLWSTVPAASLGMGLAILGLVQEKRARQAASIGLWINGAIAVLIVPLAIAVSMRAH